MAVVYANLAMRRNTLSLHYSYGSSSCRPKTAGDPTAILVAFPHALELPRTPHSHDHWPPPLQYPWLTFPSHLSKPGVCIIGALFTRHKLKLNKGAAQQWRPSTSVNPSRQLRYQLKSTDFIRCPHLLPSFVKTRCNFSSRVFA